MERRTIQPRPNWEQRLQEVGFTWYAPTEEHPVPYWSEDAYYAFTPQEIGTIQRDAQEITRLVLNATGHAIERGRLSELGIPEFLHNAIRESWDRDDPTVYMRLDLAYDGRGHPKLLEVNAQTPTSLIEAAVSQWQWLEDQLETGQMPGRTTQWNTIHEGLLEQWAHVVKERGVSSLHFSAGRSDEDIATVTYLRELAQQAGASASFLLADEIGSSTQEPCLLDTWSLPIRNLMWLWPFEYAWESRDAQFLSSTQTRFIEPLWKAVTGSKALLALLHELNPTNDLILPATLNAGRLGPNVVRKPVYSREGQNVTLPGQAATPGAYDDLPVIEQLYTALPTFHAHDGPRYPVLGVWIAGDEVCGLGLREGRSRVTDNRATFAPHVIAPTDRWS